MKELTLQASVDNLREVRAFVDAFLEPLNCPTEDKYQLCLVVDELFTNIASYAYGPEGGSVTIRLGFDEASRTVQVTMIDRGFRSIHSKKRTLTSWSPLTIAPLADSEFLS